MKTGVKIVCDGTPNGSRVLDAATGEDLTARLAIIGVTFIIRPREIPIAVLECYGELEAVGESQAKSAGGGRDCDVTQLLVAYRQAIIDLRSSGKALQIVAPPLCDSRNQWRSHVTLDGRAVALVWDGSAWGIEP
jgi:hypothetical protein